MKNVIKGNTYSPCRLECEYDSIEDKCPAPVASGSPDSDCGDHYENLPTVIRQGSQVQSDGLTLQSINIQGPKARFDGSLESSSAAPPENSHGWDLLQGSLHFAYGPQQSLDDESSDYTSLKEIGGGLSKEGATPLLAEDIMPHSESQHSIGSSSETNRLQTDV